MHATPSRSTPFWLIPILGALVAFAPLSIDMYLSAFPQLARDFPALPGVAQYSLACYLIGMAVGQIFYGPFSDRCGRKLPLYVGIAVYIIAPVGCALATSPAALLACRFLQAGRRLRFWRRDPDGHGARPVRPAILGPHAVAPDAGDGRGADPGALDRQPCAVGLWLARHLLGTGRSYRRAGHRGRAFRPARVARLRHAPPQHLAGRFVARLLAHAQRKALHGLCAGGGVFDGLSMFAYIAASPSVLIEHYGLTPQVYTWVFGMNAFGLIGASQLNHHLLARFTPDRILALSLALMCVFGLSLLVAGVSGKAALLKAAGIAVRLCRPARLYLAQHRGRRWPRTAPRLAAPRRCWARSASAFPSLLKQRGRRL
ncbi:MFS transporter [Massilia sp. B-10]|nr:MFS transporter [Massilia sp. B-10]